MAFERLTTPKLRVFRQVFNFSIDKEVVIFTIMRGMTVPFGPIGLLHMKLRRLNTSLTVLSNGSNGTFRFILKIVVRYRLAVSS